MTPNEMLTKCAEVLKNKKKDMVQLLKPFAERNLEPDLLFACFEIFHMQEYSMNWNTFRKKKNADGKQILDAEFNDHLDNDNPQSILPELNILWRQIQGEWTQKDGVECTAKHEEQLINWFKECWFEAGGKNSKIPTYFTLEKEFVYRDIESGQILKEKEVAEKLGYVVEASF